MLVGQISQRQDILDQRRTFVAGDAIGSGKKMEIFTHRQVFINAKEIWYITDVAANSGGIFGDIDAVDGDGAFPRFDQRGENFDG